MKVEQLKNRTIALFIDADNVPSHCYDQIENDLRKFGELRIKRIYGDFSSSSINGWKNKEIRCRMVPVQQFSKTGGNSTDMRLLIDAIDIIYKNPEIDTFCIASSDADYTSLILRLHESGKKVIVAGRQPISNEMMLAADVLIKLESNDKTLDQNQEFIPKRQKKLKKYLVSGDENHEIYKLTLFGAIQGLMLMLSGSDGWCKKNLLGLEYSKLIKKKENLICFPIEINHETQFKDVIKFYENLFLFKGAGLNMKLKLK